MKRTAQTLIPVALMIAAVLIATIIIARAAEPDPDKFVEDDSGEGVRGPFPKPALRMEALARSMAVQ